MAPELIAVIRFLRMEEFREVSLEEIKLAAEAWAAEQRSNPRARSYAKSASYFIFVAKKWLRFHGKLRMPSPPRARFADELDDFVSFMATEQGLSAISIESHRWKTSKFLEWFANRHRLLSSATLDDVDEFLAFKANDGWNRKSVSTGEIEGELVNIRVTVLGITFESTVDHFLQLGRDRGIDFARRNRVFQKAVVRLSP